MTSRRRGARLSILGIALALLAVFTAPAGAADHDPLLEGLAGPLGLAVGTNGTIYVGEAFAGKLTSITKQGKVTTIIDEPGTEVAGVDAKGAGTLVFTHTIFAGEPGEEAPPLEAALKRYQPSRTGTARTIASTLEFEERHNPDAINTYGLVDPTRECLDQWPPFVPQSYEGIVESHPYAVAIVPGGYMVADAAANAILDVRANGRVSTYNVLPPIRQVLTEEVVEGVLNDFEIDISKCVGVEYDGEPVPTDIEVGPDGHFYVSTLPGFPEAPGAGSVWMLNKYTRKASLVATGLNGPVDIAVDRHGTIWVAELFGFQISTISGGAVTPYMFAHSPGAIEIARDGTVYATTGVFAEEGGELVVIGSVGR